MSRAPDLREAGRVAAAMITTRWKALTTQQVDAALIHHDWAVSELAALLRAGAHVDPEPFRQPGEPAPAPHPGTALLTALDQHPRSGDPLAVAPTSSLSEFADGAGGWRNLNRALVVATHDWSQVNGPIPVAVRRGVLADVAALSDAVALLQRDLAHDLEALDYRRELVLPLRIWAHVLETSAKEALTHALRGPTRDGWTPPASNTPQILPVARAQEIPQAAGILARMLSDRRLRLEAASALEMITAHAMTTILAGTFLQAAGQHDTARALRQHGSDLVAGTEAFGTRLWSRIQRPHEHPLAQTRELHWAVARALRHSTPAQTYPLVRVAAEYAALTPAITAGLKKQVQAAGTRRDWARIDESGWHPAEPAHLAKLVTTLERGLQRITHLGPTVIKPDTSQAFSPKAAHRVLAAARSQVQHGTAHRPPPPAQPSRPARPR
jgi:hypothetical protein